MEKEKNTNCLEGMKCPECGSLEPFDIRVTVTMEVSDLGTDDYNDVEWENGSQCCCRMCGFDGVVSDFKVEDSENVKGS